MGDFYLNEKRRRKNVFDVAANGSQCVMECDLKGCLICRNIDSKSDEKRHKTEDEKLPKEDLDIIRNSTRKSFDRPEILIEATSFNCQTLFHNTDKAKITPDHVRPSVMGHTTCSYKDYGQANENAMNTESSLNNSPVIGLNAYDDRSDQDDEHEARLLASAKAVHRNLNGSPWKEVWSALQDRNLATCLSTKSMDVGRDIPGTSFSTRTCLHSMKRREKPQRMPSLYNKRKTVPTTRVNKTQIPSFDAVIFNSLIRDVRRSQDFGITDDIGKCEECTNLMEFKDNTVQTDSDEGRRCGKHESKCVKDKTIGLPQITQRLTTDRYKSRFRVRLLPLVAKSDSLPNLTSTTTSAPSELIVTAPMSVKNKNRMAKLVKEQGQLIKKSRHSRSMSLDSMFSMESFAAYQEKKDKGINVQGFQILPNLKHIEPKKYQSTSKLNDTDISDFSNTCNREEGFHVNDTFRRCKK